MLIVCKICEKTYHDEGNFGQHVKRKHGLTIWEYREKYEGFKIPVCPFCGEKCYSHGKVFNVTCGKEECFRKSREQTNLKRYGSTMSSKNAEVKEKARKTNLEKYGVEWTSQAKEVRAKQIETCIERYGVPCNLSLEENKEKVKQTNLKKYGVENPGQSKEVQEKMRRTNRERRGVDYTWESEEVRRKSKETLQRRYGVDNTLKSKEIRERGCKTRLELYGAEYPTQLKVFREKAKKTCLERYGVENVLQNPEIHKKQKSRQRARNFGFDSMPEKKMADMLSARGVCFTPHYNLNGKEWDFAIFQNGSLKCLIEIDGEYNHGLLSDPDGKLIKGNLDYRRFSLVPDGVNFVVVDSQKVNETNLPEILNWVYKEYEDFVAGVFGLLPRDFPYPVYSENRMRLDWKHLVEYNPEPKQLLGRSIIRNFHKSLWNRRVGGSSSPVEIWSDKKLLEERIRNKSMYTSIFSSHDIVDCFEDCGCSSGIRPSVAKYLLMKHAPDAKAVVDPFMQFSGSMLGACATGKKYVGFCCDETVMEESRRLADFLNLDAEIFNEVPGTRFADFDVLLTHVDHPNVVDWCPEKFDCKLYIFVSDVLLPELKVEPEVLFDAEEDPTKNYVYCVGSKLGE